MDAEPTNKVDVQMVLCSAYQLNQLVQLCCNLPSFPFPAMLSVEYYDIQLHLNSGDEDRVRQSWLRQHQIHDR